MRHLNYTRPTLRGNSQSKQWGRMHAFFVNLLLMPTLLIADKAPLLTLLRGN
ncbi:uncharacterized protein BDV17DRAFT_267404 [Aspergillus undulatus]|uniref:uncharacterized protein n=1 Tax=Aspergillus undulatus TaxID=1810928 RepID=UPI003CCD6DF5